VVAEHASECPLPTHLQTETRPRSEVGRRDGRPILADMSVQASPCPASSQRDQRPSGARSLPTPSSAIRLSFVACRPRKRLVRSQRDPDPAPETRAEEWWRRMIRAASTPIAAADRLRWWWRWGVEQVRRRWGEALIGRRWLWRWRRSVVVRPVPGKAMPVILTGNACDIWLEADAATALKLQQPWPIARRSSPRASGRIWQHSG
jgi:hypothetical protein